MYDSKFKFIVIFVAIFVLITSIQDTYGKYKSDATGTTNMSIARWNIVINNQDIVTNNYITNTLTPYFVENEHVASGVLAPSVVGYFDLNIDCSAVDVSFNYSISSSISETSSVDDLVVIGYSINGGAIVPVDGMLDFNETVLLSDQTKIRNIRIYIKWDDSETETMNNASDTLAALSGLSAKINVDVNFTQVIN